jgi:hypothetical protein
LTTAQVELKEIQASMQALEKDKFEKELECEQLKEDLLKRQQFRVPIPSVLAAASKDGINSIVLQLVESMKQVKELASANSSLAEANEQLKVLVSDLVTAQSFIYEVEVSILRPHKGSKIS